MKYIITRSNNNWYTSKSRSRFAEQSWLVAIQSFKCQSKTDHFFFVVVNWRLRLIMTSVTTKKNQWVVLWKRILLNSFREDCNLVPMRSPRISSLRNSKKLLKFIYQKVRFQINTEQSSGHRKLKNIYTFRKWMWFLKHVCG